MYYDDESAFTGIATRTTVIDGVQYHGLITRFSSPKSTWNWDAQNNVVVTTPTLEIGNFESAAKGTSLLDEFYSKNYLGRKVELYLGFQNATTAADIQQIYSGRIQDLNFSEGKISVLFKATAIPTNDLAGKLIDYETRKVGTISSPGVPKEVGGLRVPVIYGKVWDAPGVCVEYEADYSVADKSYLFNDDSKWSAITTNGAQLTGSTRKSTARSERMIYIPNNDYLVPVSSYDITSDGTRLWTYSGTTYSGLLVTIDSSNQQYLDNSINVSIPIRIGEAPSVQTGSSCTVSGTFANFVDGNTSTYMQVTVVGGTTEADMLFLANENLITYNLKYMVDGQGFYGFNTARPIHVGDKGAPDATWFHGKVGILSSNQSLPNVYDRFSFESVIYGRDGISLVGGTGWGNYGGNAWWYPTTAPSTLEKPCGVAAGTWTTPFTGSGFIETAYDYSSYGGAENILDGTLSMRESLENFRLGVGLNWNSITLGGGSYGGVWAIYEWFLLHASIVDLPKDYIYAEAEGPTASDGSLFFSLGNSGVNAPIKRPYQYVEAILRNLGFGDSDLDQESFENIDTLWGDTFWDRRDFSGFVITETTPFDEFVKKYFEYETFSMYRDELGKFKMFMLKDSYTSANVDAVIDFNACTSFDMGISALKSVVTNIDNVRVDKQYFGNEYTYNTSWNIAASGGYSYGFYDYTNDETTGVFTMKELAKPYTSHARNTCIAYSGASYSVRKDHTSGGTYVPTNTTYYTPTTYFAKDRVWESGLAYSCESAEAYHIARRYLNQFGNRHRTIKLTSNDMDFYKFQIGDVVSFENVPDTLLGMSVSGFGGSTASSVTLNGQTVYPYFMIYSVLKDGQKVEMECFQLHKLDDLVIKRGASVAS